MGRNNSCFQILATTGTGIVIGTGAIQFAGCFRSSDLAGTLVLKSGASTILTMSADRSISLATPVAISGPVTMTSSAGNSFVILFRDM